MVSSTGSAPGRLDLLGGVADYSGALVLEVPTRLTTTVVAEPADTLAVGPVELTVADVRALWPRSYPDSAPALAPFPRWTHYLLGVAMVLVRHGEIDVPQVRLSVSSEVPQAVGVSSSAALEVGHHARPRRRSDRFRCSSPRGAKKRRTRSSARPAGSWTRSSWPWATPGRPCRSSAGLPGRRTGGHPGWLRDRRLAHRRRRRERRSLSPRAHRRLHGQAHRGGTNRTAARRGSASSPPTRSSTCPSDLDGATYLDRWRGTDDPLTTIDPDSVSTRCAPPPCSASRNTNGASERSRPLRRRRPRAALGELMRCRVTAGYDEIGLGDPAATAARPRRCRSRPGVVGARLERRGLRRDRRGRACERDVLDDVPGLIR